MGARRLRSLVYNLPPDSAVGRSYTAGWAWGWQEEALTTLLELVHAHVRVTLRAAGAKRHQVPKPLTVDRPWEQAEKERQKAEREPATVEDVVAVMAGLGAGVGPG